MERCEIHGNRHTGTCEKCRLESIDRRFPITSFVIGDRVFDEKMSRTGRGNQLSGYGEVRDIKTNKRGELGIFVLFDGMKTELVCMSGQGLELAIIRSEA